MLGVPVAHTWRLEVRSRAFPSTMWIPETELRLSGLATRYLYPLSLLSGPSCCLDRKSQGGFRDLGSAISPEAEVTGVSF